MTKAQPHGIINYKSEERGNKMKMFLLGMVVMSVFSAVGAMIVENGNNEGLGYLLMGPAIWIIGILGFMDKLVKMFGKEILKLAKKISQKSEI